MVRRSLSVWPLAAVAAVAVACSVNTDGSARPAPSALAVLPTEGEISSAVGNPLSTFGFRPFAGGVEILPDGYRTDDDASPISCVAVTDTAPRVVYEDQRVSDVARQSYFNWDDGVHTSGADAAVVRFATDGDARQTFDAFAKNWRDCDGTMVIKRTRGAANGQIDAAIADVRRDGSMLSATVRTRPRAGMPQSRYDRALGVRGDAIVEVSLAIASTGDQRADPGGSAARVADAMLDKVAPG